MTAQHAALPVMQEQASRLDSLSFNGLEDAILAVAWALACGALGWAARLWQQRNVPARAQADDTVSLQRKLAECTQALEAHALELHTMHHHLARAEKLAAVGKLTAGLAHELNNPLAVIQGNLDLTRTLLGTQAHAVSTELALMDEQVERMRLMVMRWLQFVRPEQPTEPAQAVDTARVVDDCLVLVGHLLGRSRITVQRRSQATRRPTFHRQDLQQVLVNLVVNAIQAMPDGGTLTLGTYDAPDPRGVGITVADTGPGLSDQALADLFQPFVTSKKDGTGLGLWISRSLMERRGGQLTAANRGDGVRGAVFTVRLAL